MLHDTDTTKSQDKDVKVGKQLALKIGQDLASAVEERLEARLSSYECEKPRVRVSHKSRKWLMSSAWQKAIRRGDAETARKMVYGLVLADPDYAWRRMPAVAFEDVGVANLPLVTDVIWVCGKTKWRMNHGNAELAMMLTEELAHSAKCRVACDLEVWTDIDPELKPVREAYAKLSRDELFEIAAWKGEPVGHRMIAMRYLAGTDYWTGECFPKRPGSFGDVQSLCTAMGLSDDDLALVTWARNKAGPMALALPFSIESMNATGAPTPINDEMVDLPKIGPYPSYTFDLHNHQGKRAIAYFAKACQPVREWLMDHGIEAKDVKDTIVELLFRAETELLDVRLHHKITNETRYGSWAANVCYWSPLAREWVVPAVDMLRQHLDALHEARVKVFKN
jgi:hypothetical protein